LRNSAIHFLNFISNCPYGYVIWDYSFAPPLGQAIVAAVTSGSKRFFLGTDSAPHERRRKECPCGCAGIFNAPVALSLYAKVFEEVTLFIVGVSVINFLLVLILPNLIFVYSFALFLVQL
jgi:hypothetical protein